MKRVSFAAVILLAFTSLLVGCGDDAATEPGATFDLTFTGDASFHGPHGGQTIRMSIIEQGSGNVVAERTGTVSADADPSFSFTVADGLVEGTSYNLDYWIDSNFGGGESGKCDSPEVDHQWRIAVPSVSEDVVINDTHRPGETEDVCSSSSSGPSNPNYSKGGS